MSKIGLVLEGGGFRGAYTAGALSWLIDHDITFDYGTGISSGAMHLCFFLEKQKEYMRVTSVEYMSDKTIVGLYPLLHEGKYVGYDRMFDDLLVNEVGFTCDGLKELNTKNEIGLFDVEKGDTVFVDVKEATIKMLKASCSLPIVGKTEKINGSTYFDGGIKIMVPIERSVEQGNDKHLVIVTKPAGYIRKPAGFFLRTIMKLFFLKQPKVGEIYTIRHINYEKQMNQVYDLEKEGKALLVRPSKTIPVARFKGDRENLEKLYQLGYQDMEDRKEEILKFLEKAM